MSAQEIVVGIDGSRFSAEALRWALGEAASRDTTVRALIVADRPTSIGAGRPTMMGLGTMPALEPDEKYLRLAETVAREVLGEHRDPRLSTELLRGSPPETLCDAAADAQLLVLGSRGHGQLFEGVLGSVSQYCVRHASCPVVVIPVRMAESAEDFALNATESRPQPVSLTVVPDSAEKQRARR